MRGDINFKSSKSSVATRHKQNYKYFWVRTILILIAEYLYYLILFSFNDDRSYVLKDGVFSHNFDFFQFSAVFM